MTKFYVVINKWNTLVWRDIERTQGAAYGCAYTSRHHAEKLASKVGGFVYSVQGLFFPNGFDRTSEYDHDIVAQAVPNCFRGL